MGSFQGHIHASSSFLFFGMRWLYCVLMRYHLCRKEAALVGPKARPFKSSIIYPMSCCPSVPIDAWIILIASVLEIASEFITIIPMFGGFTVLMTLQHTSGIAFCAIAAVVLIAKHHGCVTIPSIDYAGVILAMVMNWFIFTEHTLGKSPVEAKVHIYFAVLNLVIALMLALEAKYRNNVLFSVGRAFVSMVTGSWFVNIAFILYTPVGTPLDENSKESLKLIPLIFMWNIVFNVVGLFVTNFVTICRVRCMTPDQVREALDVSYAQASTRVRTRDSEHCKYLLCDGEPDDE